MKIIREDQLFYVEELGKDQAVITFIEKDNTILINHTYVSNQYRGQGIAKLLVDEVAEYARENNLKLAATCSYAKHLLNKDNQYKDVLE